MIIDNEIILLTYNIVDKIFKHDKFNLILKVNNQLCTYSSKEHELNEVFNLFCIDNTENFTIENNTIIIKYTEYSVSIPYNAIILIIDLDNAKVFDMDHNNNNILNIYNVSSGIIRELIKMNDNRIDLLDKFYNYIKLLSPDINKLKLNINLSSFSMDIGSVSVDINDDINDNNDRNVVYISCCKKED